ncbi:LacI family DNA-binding transcriptional regulator [Coraliomargarita parva]|uniref:LacI family DNA-binding transcriptional regulator n=1 Tax=Coraliomargarita parva TaxID=3014050 RepID=UPI0022B40645|nr:LacI family DNA-binding transcriptional regulator [Coraliomargarita parva]
MPELKESSTIEPAQAQPIKTKQVSHSTIAKSVGVSRAAVSHVLNGREHMVSDETRKKILKAVEQSGYHRNALIRAIKSDVTHVVGILVPSMNISTFSEIVYAAETLAKNEGWQIFLCQTHSLPETAAKEIKTLREYRADGLMIVTVSGDANAAEYQALTRDNLPLVLVDVPSDSLKTTFVGNDHALGAYDATKYLLDTGHTRIALIKGYTENPNIQQRQIGYKKALCEAGIEFDERLVFDLNFSFEAGKEAVANLTNTKVPFDAIITSSDHCSVGAIEELKERGLKVPDDVSIIGWGDLEFCRYTTPTLSTIDQQSTTLGETAMRYLLEQIRTKQNKLKQSIISPKLIIRGSVAQR